MAYRPRQHILETESKKAFDSILPSEWVIRSNESDYGLDAQVQIFENGVSTPFLFFVQLKATDSIKKLSQTPTFYFSTERLLEYSNYPLPVLLVLYDANWKRLFYRWTHALFNELDFNDKRKLHIQESFTVRFENQLNLNNSDILSNEVKEYFRSAELYPESSGNLFININLNLEKEIAEDVLNDLKNWLESNPNIRFLKDNSVENSDILIEGITDWKAITAFYSDHKIAFPFIEVDELTNDDLKITLLAILKVILAHLLAISGRINASIDIFTKFLIEDCYINSSIEYLLSQTNCISLFILKKRTFEAFEIAEKLLEKGFINLASLFATTLNFNNLNDQIGVNRYQTFLKKVINSSTDSQTTGIQSYNLANSLRLCGNCREAIIFYCKAAKAESSYLSKSYWWAELGGCFFILNKLKWAEYSYKKAIELGEKRLPIHGLLGDVLLYQGKFKEASDTFGIYLNETEFPQSEGILKKWLSEVLVNRYGDKVKRDFAKANEYLCYVENLVNSEDQKKMIESALLADPLNELACFNYAVHKRDFESWLFASIVNNNDPESWANAVLLLFNELSKSKEDFNLFHTAIINEAWRSSVKIEDIVKNKFPEEMNPKLINEIMDRLLWISDHSKNYFDQDDAMTLRIITRKFPN
jgi:hypothetical protein